MSQQQGPYGQGPYGPQPGTGQPYGYPGQAQPGQPPYPPADQPVGNPYQQQRYGYAYPEQSQGTTILILGILGISACQLLAPVAWKMGKDEIAAIDAGRRSPEGRQHANIGRILGMVGTILIGLIIAFYFVFFVFFGFLGVLGA